MGLLKWTKFYNILFKWRLFLQVYHTVLRLICLWATYLRPLFEMQPLSF